MCDCSSEKGDLNKAQVPLHPFAKCSEQNFGEKDGNFLQKEIFNCKDRYGTRMLKSEPALPLCNNFNQPSSSECSSNSTRTV